MIRPSLLVVLATLLALEFPTAFSERGRLILQACIALVVLGMYFRQFVKHQPSFMEAAGLLVVGGGFFYVISKAAFTAALSILVLALAWMVMTWVARRWALRRGLTTLAVFLLVVQASLHTAQLPWKSVSLILFHRWLDLACISLLVLIAFVSSRTWHEQRLALPIDQRRSARLWSTAGLSAPSVAALFIAWLQVPLPAPAIYFGCTAAIFVMLVAWKSRLWLWQSPSLRWISPALLIIPLNQAALGLYTVHGGELRPWMPLMMLINGKAILALSLVMTASAWAANAPDRPQGAQLTTGKRPPAV